MKLESTFSSVVLPVPVPPLTTTFSRPLTHRLMKCATCGVNDPKLMRSSTVYGSLENFRIVMNGPPIASGCTIDVHTGTVGEAGVDHRVRLVDASADLAHDLVDDAPEVRLVDELHLVDERQLAARARRRRGRGPFTMTSVMDSSRSSWSIGPVPEDVVGDRLHERLALGDGEGEALLAQRAEQLLVDLAPELGLRDALVGEQRAQLVDDELVHLLAHFLELVLALVHTLRAPLLLPAAPPAVGSAS